MYVCTLKEIMKLAVIVYCSLIQTLWCENVIAFLNLILQQAMYSTAAPPKTCVAVDSYVKCRTLEFALVLSTITGAHVSHCLRAMGPMLGALLICSCSIYTSNSYLDLAKNQPWGSIYCLNGSIFLPMQLALIHGRSNVYKLVVPMMKIQGYKQQTLHHTVVPLN